MMTDILQDFVRSIAIAVVMASFVTGVYEILTYAGSSKTGVPKMDNPPPPPPRKKKNTNEVENK